ncbi:MAG: leucine-rich repeat domain-containing protein [Clostridia bacterium]|nr:leucine-rich repeat domain-containing protein [Clostridia bacterium]
MKRLFEILLICFVACVVLTLVSCGSDKAVTYVTYSNNTAEATGNRDYINATSVTIGNHYKHYNVTKVLDNAFRGFTKLESVTLGHQIDEIGKGAFDGCTIKHYTGPLRFLGSVIPLENLVSVTLTDGKAIESGYFKDLSLLEYVSLPDSIEEIGEYAFSGCSALKQVEMPKELDELGVGAFENCESLEGISVPYGVTEVEERAFSGCESLKWVQLSEKISKIGDYAFFGCESLEKIQVPYRVRIIGKEAFYGCYSMNEAIFECPYNWIVLDERIGVSDANYVAKRLSVTSAEWIREY